MTDKKCPECDGKGNDGYHKKEECPLCDGTGKIKLKEVKKKKW